MLITDPNELNQYATPYRIWQGIPGIEVTKNGRIFVSFYGGGTDEGPGNVCYLAKSDDGLNFSEPIAAAFYEAGRCFDSGIWIDPLGRLWFYWSVMPKKGVYATICDDPDAHTLTWSKPFFIGHEIMLNKPIVLSSGEWLFPVASWDAWIMRLPILDSYYDSDAETGSFVYRSLDQGRTFEKLGAANIIERLFDEHMVLELMDGRLAMFVRTRYGIGVSYSLDKGVTWSDGVDSGLGGPNSRFHIRRLRSGRVLLINHINFTGRNNLTALLSEDDGKTWAYKLLLDGRCDVSYPDAVEASDGFIYVAYDRERGAGLFNMEDVYKQAREILYARITEEDIIAGKLVNPESKLQCIVSKLGEYAGTTEGLFDGKEEAKKNATANVFLEKYADDLPNMLAHFCPVALDKMCAEDCQEFDRLALLLNLLPDKKSDILKQMLALIRGAACEPSCMSMEERVKTICENLAEDVTEEELAKKLGVSIYHMRYQFLKSTNMTVGEYLTERKV